MTKIQKFTIVGGGSSYTPELIDGLLKSQNQMTIDEIVLYDIEPERVEIVSQMVRRQVHNAGAASRVTTTTNRRHAVEGAEFVISQIRVGGMQARVLDEKIPFRYEILGQETTGPGGTFKAWRTIPASLEIAEDVVRYAPGAWFLNFTNPSGIVTEALYKYSDVKTLGLCDVPVNAQYTIASALQVEPSRVFLEWMGMNHVNWVKRVLLDGVDCTAEIMNLIEQQVHARLNYRFPCDIELVRALGVLPNFYLQYYYHHPRVMRQRKAEEKTRGEVVLEIEKTLFAKYADPNQMTKPSELSKRGGAMYSGAAIPMILSIVQDRRDVQVVVTRNQGAIPDLDDDAAVEVPCMLGKHGAVPLQMGRLPDTIRGLAQQVKAWESLTVEAGATGSRRTALAAIMANPLVPSLEVGREVMGELMSAHCEYLPQFFPK
jgi:6-phospho-beta-glucosidase